MNGPGPEPQALSVGAAEPGLDLRQDRERDLLRLLGTEMQTDGTVERCSACLGRLKPSLRELGQQSFGSRARPEYPDIRALGLERETQITPVVAKVVRHDHHSRIGLQSQLLPDRGRTRSESNVRLLEKLRRR